MQTTREPGFGADRDRRVADWLFASLGETRLLRLGHEHEGCRRICFRPKASKGVRSPVVSGSCMKPLPCRGERVALCFALFTDMRLWSRWVRVIRGQSRRHVLLTGKANTSLHVKRGHERRQSHRVERPRCGREQVNMDGEDASREGPVG